MALVPDCVNNKMFKTLSLRHITMGLLCAVFLITVIYKIMVLGYHPRMVIPVVSYQVKLDMHMEGHGKEVNIRTFIPPSGGRQEITQLQPVSGSFHYTSEQSGNNLGARFYKSNAKGPHSLSLSYQAKNKTLSFALPESLSLSFESLPEWTPYLRETPLIQVRHPKVLALAKRLGISGNKNAVTIVRQAYLYVADSIQNAGFSSRTSALLALQLGEASCNGKSRLMVALLRHAGIPARLVGGLIMESGSKTTTHQWLEARLGGNWVPFCPLNHHYAEIPDRYLTLYYGDEAMFTRTANINFTYRYEMKKKMTARTQQANRGGVSWLNVLNLWEMFRQAGIPLDLLKVLLMIPLGAVVIIIFRNVIGIHTYGTFLPVLIATSYRETGLFWGHFIFVAVIITGFAVRFLLERFRLLHSPKLTIILVSVIVALLFITVIGILTGNKNLFAASMFPLAIMAITIERFSIVAESDGFKKAFIIFLWTLAVVTFCYISMLSVLLQSVIMAFPETLLLIIAVSIYLGSWNNLRLSEFIRFRKLIFETAEGAGKR
ncbi:MAG: hypothetical protein HQK83_16360 [Fibrobacteria bacterium]|nr:hypothetical protein [Fibrobacteria bacterium]